MSVVGMLDVYLVEGTVNGTKFEFNTSSLLPILKPFDGRNDHSIVVMDNASIYHVDTVYDLIENQAGAKLIYLPLI